MAEAAVVNYKRLAEFVGTNGGAELRRAIALGTVKISQDHVDGEHVGKITGPPELVKKAVAAAGLAGGAAATSQ